MINQVFLLFVAGLYVSFVFFFAKFKKEEKSADFQDEKNQISDFFFTNATKRDKMCIRVYWGSVPP